MADFYLDTSAIGNEYQAYAATPTWGAQATDVPAPMDGNGKAASAVSAAVAVAEIQLTAQPADTNTLTIAGATITAKTSVAAKNQFAIGASIAATVTNIVALLNTYGTGNNQCDAAVNSGSCVLLLALPYWQFARVKPGTTDTIQIATRIAGADLNQASNSNVTISSSGWATPPTLTQFAGGADGPFAYFSNASTVFGKTFNTYGLMVAKSPGPSEPGATDTIHIRSKRSSTNTSCSLSSSTGYTLVPPAATSRSFLADNGTVWSGDDGVFQLNVTVTANVSVGLRSVASYRLKIAARKKYGFKITWTGNNTGYTMVIGTGSTNEVFHNVEFVEATAASVLYLHEGGANSWCIVYSGCKITYASSHRVTSGFNSNTYSISFRVIDCIFVWSGVGANITALHEVQSSASYSGLISYNNCQFSVDGGAYAVAGVVAGVSSYGIGSLAILFENCLGMSNPSVGIPASTSNASGAFMWDDCGAKRPFRIETSNLTLEWVDNGTMPTYNATLPSGEAYGHRMSWETARLSPDRPQKVARYSTFFKDTAAAKTVTLELLVPTAEIPTKAQLAIFVKYTGNDDAIYYETTHEPYAMQEAGVATALPDGVGTGSWTLNGVTGVSSKKLALTTAQSVKPNTEISAELWVFGPPGSNRSIYINPDLVIS